MVIRAKDQASRILNGLSRNASANFTRLQTAASLSAQRSAIDMTRVRQNYATQILGQQKILNNALQQGNTTRANSARQTIRDLRIMQQEEVLGIRQEQIAQREIMLTAQKHEEAKRAALDSKKAAVESAGRWVIGGAVMAAAGAAGVLALHRMAMGAVEYQRQATLTLTQTDRVKTSVSELEGISTRVARSIGVPLEQLQPALYDIFSSMNVNVKESEQLLTAFAKEAVAGQVSIQDASRATIGIMNTFDIPVSKVNEVLDIQFQLVRKGVGTFGQFATVLGRATPSAVRAGQNFKTLAAMMAFLTKNGLTTAMAAASAQRALDAFANPSVAAKFANLGEVIEKHSGLSAMRLRELGIDTDKVSVRIRDAHGNFRGFIPVMGELSKVLGGLPAPSRAAILKEVFKGAGGTIQAMRYFNVVIPRFKEQNQLFHDMMRSSGAFEQAYRLMSESVAVKTEILNNNWKIFKLNLGEGAVPALNRLVVIGTKALQWFNDLTPTQRHAISQTIAFTSVVVALTGVLVALAGTVKVVGASIAILRLGGAVTSLQQMASAAIAANASFTGLVSTLGLLAGAIVLAANASTIQRKADELGARIHKEYVRPLYERLGLVGENSKQTVVFAGKTAVLTRETARGSAAQLKNYHAMTASQIAAEKMNERGLKPLSAGTKEATRAIRAHNVSLNAQKGEIAKVVAEMQKEAPAFDGVTRVAKKSAASLTRIFQNQLEDTRNYSRNLRVLLRKGADPSFVQELAKRGPEYVAAYAHGSRRELLKAQATWRAIHRAEGNMTKSMAEVAKAAIESFRKNQILDTLRASAAWKRMTTDQKKKIAAAMHDARVDVDQFQKKVNSLKGKAIQVKAVAQVEIDRMTRLYFKTASAAIRERPTAKGGPVTRAVGGPISGPGTSTSDSIPASGPGGTRYRLSDGEYIINAASTRKYRPIVEAINENRLATGGAIGALSGFYNQTVNATERMGQRLANLYASIIGKGLTKFIKQGITGGSAGIKNFIRSTDRLPYIWGGAGPGGYDCSGLVGAVALAMRGKPYGHGQRVWTTSSIHPGILGLQSGLGGVLDIGVTAGTGHMAGRYGGLGFEARSTASGIIVGAGARPPSSFARHYHMAQGGYVNPRDMRQVMALVKRHRLDVWGDDDNAFVTYNGRRRQFHTGGRLPEDILGLGSSGTAYALRGGETVSARGGGDVHIHFHAPVYGGKAGAQELVDVVVQGIAKKARTYGGTVNVTTDRRGSPVIR
jgi:TP901 family phage tail tape measure protein